MTTERTSSHDPGRPRDAASIAEIIAVREDCPAWIAIGNIRVQCQVGKLEVDGDLHREHFGKLPIARATKVAQTLDETNSSIDTTVHIAWVH